MKAYSSPKRTQPVPLLVLFKIPILGRHCELLGWPNYGEIKIHIKLKTVKKS